MTNTLKTNPYELGLAGVDTSKDNRSRVYTPTWTGATTNPVLNNGTLTANYMTRGDSILINILLLPGTLTTYGTGAWRFSFPTLQNAAYYGVGSLLMFHAATATYFTGVSLAVQGANFMQIYNNNQTVPVSAAVPFAWASGDSMILTAEYQIR
jgi:hypothetical protein